jgi:hypothetical protein
MPQRTGSCAEWLPWLRACTSALTPEKPKKRLAQTVCSLADDLLLILHNWHYPKTLLPTAPIHPQIPGESQSLTA